MMWHLERAAAKEAAGKLWRIWFAAIIVAAVAVVLFAAPRLATTVGAITYQVQQGMRDR